MKQFYPSLTVAGLLMAGLPLHARTPEPTLYGVTFFGAELIAVNPTTGESAAVGTLNAAVAGYGLASRYGRLYSFDAGADLLVEISPSTGRALRELNVGLPNLTGEGDLAFRADGVGFLATALAPDGSPASELYTFDVIAGTSHRLGSAGLAIDALAFGPNGTLYALGQGEGTLYRLDQNTGAATEVGSLGIPQNSPFAAMTFAPDGKLYVGVDDRLYEVNPATGAATAVDPDVLDLGFSSVSGLAFQFPDTPSQLYALTLFGNELLSVTADGSAESVGPLGANVNGFGLAARGGTLYTFDSHSRLVRELNLATGGAAGSFTVGFNTVAGEGDLAFRGDGVGFLTAAFNGSTADITGRLFAFDLSGGRPTFIGSTSVPLDALAFDADDVLYALGQGEGKLYTVNQQNAVLTAVGELGVPQNSPFAALTFAPDGTLYAVLDDRLFVVNKLTGAASPVDPLVLDLGFSSVSGLAFAPAAAHLDLAPDAAGPALFWTGPDYALETTDQLGGPWVTAVSQGNPQRLALDGGERYFRLRR